MRAEKPADTGVASTPVSGNHALSIADRRLVVDFIERRLNNVKRDAQCHRRPNEFAFSLGRIRGNEKFLEQGLLKRWRGVGSLRFVRGAFEKPMCDARYVKPTT